MSCYLAQHGIYERGTMPPCEGQLIKAHLLPRQLLRRELGPIQADEAIRNPASWVPACGGPQGQSGHHGMLDTARTLRVPYEALPVPLIALAEALGLAWWVCREFDGPATLSARCVPE